MALLEDDNGMELLVNNKIISLDLPVKDVYNKVIQFFCGAAWLEFCNILVAHLLSVYVYMKESNINSSSIFEPSLLTAMG